MISLIYEGQKCVSGDVKLFNIVNENIALTYQTPEDIIFSQRMAVPGF